MRKVRKSYELDDDGLTTMIAIIRTTDIAEDTGGWDTIEGQDDNDVIIGGVNNGGTDHLYGDAATPIGADGQDVMLGDNGELIFNSDTSITFWPTSAVDIDTEEISLVNHGLATGTAVLYDNLGGTSVGRRRCREWG